MKIVFLAPFGIRPKGTLIARMIPLAAALQELGHTVVIVAPPYTNPDDSGKTEIVNGVTLKNISLGAFGKLLRVPVLSWRMFRAALTEQPDVLHLFKPKGYGGFAAMLVAVLRWMGMKMPPLLVDTDDWEGKGGMNDLHPYSAAERLVFQWQEQLLMPHADGVTVASRTLQTKVWGMGVEPERVLYLPNCVGKGTVGDGMTTRSRLSIADDAPIVLLYTRFFEFNQKKLHYIFAGILHHVPNVHFLVIGKGNNGEEELLHRFAAERGGALTIVGWLEPSQLPDYLAAGNVALYPLDDTLVNRAKCPAKLTELMLAGVPVVADRVGQAAEYIEPSVSGELCRPDDWDEMVTKAVSLLRDRTRQEKMANNARQNILTNFTWEAQAQKLVDFFEKIIVV